MPEQGARTALRSDLARRRGVANENGNVSRQRLAAVDWARRTPVLMWRDWVVYLDESLDHFTVFVEAAARRIVTSADTWETLACHGEAQLQFLQDMSAGGSGMKFIVADSGHYAEAVRKQARTKPPATPAAPKDRLQVLSENAIQLIMQITQLNRDGTEGQHQVLAVRLSRLQQALREVQVEVDQLAATVQLAATALFDATL